MVEILVERRGRREAGFGRVEAYSLRGGRRQAG